MCIVQHAVTHYIDVLENGSERKMKLVYIYTHKKAFKIAAILPNFCFRGVFMY